MRIRVIGAILLASALLSGPVLAEDMSDPVATAVTRIRAAIVAKDQDMAQQAVNDAKALPDRTAYDDFKIAEMEADVRILGKSSKAEVLGLQKLLASPFMANETADERARYVYNLMYVENDLIINADERITLGKRLIDSGMRVDDALSNIAFAYLNKLDQVHAAALATIMRDRQAAKDQTPNDDIQRLFKLTKGGYKKAALDKAVAAFQAEIAAGEGAYVAANEVSFDLMGCTASHMDKNKLPAKILTLALSPEENFGATAKWTGDCVNGEAVGAGAVVRRRPLDNGMLYSVFFAPNGLANLTNEDWTNFQTVTERTEADGHHYLIPPPGVYGGTFDPSYDLSVLPFWARTALERIGVGDLSQEHNQMVAAQQQKAQEEQDARDEAQRQADEAQAEADQQAAAANTPSVMGAILGGLAQGIAQAAPYAIAAQQQQQALAAQQRAQQQAQAQALAAQQAAQQAQLRAEQLAFQKRAYEASQAQYAAQAQAAQQQQAQQQAQLAAAQAAQAQANAPKPPANSGNTYSYGSSGNQQAMNYPQTQNQGQPAFKDWVQEAVVGKTISIQNYGNRDAYVTLTIYDCQNLQSWNCGQVATNILVSAGTVWTYNVQPMPYTANQGTDAVDSGGDGAAGTLAWGFQYRYTSQPR